MMKRAVGWVGLFVGFLACSSPPAPSTQDCNPDDDSSCDTGTGAATAKDAGAAQAPVDSGHVVVTSDAALPPPVTIDAGGIAPIDVDSSVPIGSESSCGSMTTADACYACCDSFHNSGSAAADQAYDACVCNSPGTCASVCGQSYCAGNDPQPGDACERCLERADNGQCGDRWDQVCQSSADCQASEACAQANACDSKP